MDEQDMERLRAELRLHRARQRLYDVQRAAAMGHLHEAHVCEALDLYRQALEAYALAAQETGGRRVEADAPAAGAAFRSGRTARLQFARWLVDTGRLSEWDVPVAPAAAAAPAAPASPAAPGALASPAAPPDAAGQGMAGAGPGGR